MNQIYQLIRRNIPDLVRSEEEIMRLLKNPDTRVITLKNRDESEIMAGTAYLNNTILFLCVDEAHRGDGIGSHLLNVAEISIRAQGFTKAIIGAGEGYIMPGIPTNKPVIEELPSDDQTVSFFQKRGYHHGWDCDCFDMQLDLCNFSAELPKQEENITYRWAISSDIQKIAAHEQFTTYYENPELYKPWSKQRVLVAVMKDDIAGAAIVGYETEGKGIGSVGCMTVKQEYRRRGIATQLAILATSYLKEAGLEKAFIGYTYSGLDKLYGKAGYEISKYYYMAEKDL